MSKELNPLAKEMAIQALSPSNKNLYQALQANIVEAQQTLSQPNNREERNKVFAVLQDCKKLQEKLLAEIVAPEETQDALDVSPFKKAGS